MIPIDGPMRENVGLLGSPAFEIPRMVDRDRDMNASIDETTRRTRLRQKNRYNAVTAVLFVLSRWMSVLYPSSSTPASMRMTLPGRMNASEAAECPRAGPAMTFGS
jgi:hypothetical protein